MSNDNLLPFSFPAVQRKKITAAFDGGRITSDGGVMLLAQAERRLGIAERLAQVIPDRRDQDRVTHLLPDIVRAIACGYENAVDLDRLRFDPAPTVGPRVHPARFYRRPGFTADRFAAVYRSKWSSFVI